MTRRHEHDYVADDAWVHARNMPTLDLLAWRERLVADIAEPYCETDADNAVVIAIATTTLVVVDQELARRERISRREKGVTSPADHAFVAIRGRMDAVKQRVTVAAYLTHLGWDLRRIGQDRQGREKHSGACPICRDGDDRFACWGLPTSGYACRQCLAHGDVVTMAQQVHGISFTEAILELEAFAGLSS